MGDREGEGVRDADGPAPPAAIGLAFDDFYDATFVPLARSLRLAGAGAAAEDLAQEALTRCYQRWARVSRMVNPTGYAFTVAYRILRRPLRRRLPDQLVTDQPGVAEEATTQVALAATVTAMPPRQRAVAVLCIVEGWEPSEAAAALRMSASTARVHLATARTQLRGALD